MPSPMPFKSSLDQLILNDNGLYEGNLVKYFQVLFNDAKNVNLPYHNFRHIIHITWLCHDACDFYVAKLSKREMRNLLIAAIFHDFDHQGIPGDDSINIANAIKGLEKHILPQDKPYLKDIKFIIESTKYPYHDPSESMPLLSQIIREADLSQSLSPAWLQHVIFGLAAEWKTSPISVLKEQVNFHKNLRFLTEWGKKTWPKEEIEKKRDEISRLLKILEMKT